MKGFIPAQIVIEYRGVQASLTHYGRMKGPSIYDYWECADHNIKRILDIQTARLIEEEGVLKRPFCLILTDWAIKAGKLTAERLGAKIISIRPMTPPSEPLDLGKDVVV